MKLFKDNVQIGFCSDYGSIIWKDTRFPRELHLLMHDVHLYKLPEFPCVCDIHNEAGKLQYPNALMYPRSQNMLETAEFTVVQDMEFICMLDEKDCPWRKQEEHSGQDTL